MERMAIGYAISAFLGTVLGLLLVASRFLAYGNGDPETVIGEACLQALPHADGSGEQVGAARFSLAPALARWQARPHKADLAKTHGITSPTLGQCPGPLRNYLHRYQISRCYQSALCTDSSLSERSLRTCAPHRQV